MGFELEGSKFRFKDLLLRPGCIVTVLGFIILAVAVAVYSHRTGNVDYMNHPEQIARPGANIKIMVWMVGGIVTMIVGALLSFLDFTRR